MNRPEILAPAGSMEALTASVCAGADAVYLGGSRFGARAYADNFSDTALIEGIEYCHIYGVKVYLTVNTLFRNEEIDALFDYLKPLYEAGLDAVIVQDVGVMKYIHRNFPDLPIHASTQMTITTQYAYELLADYGVTRIVPARELSLSELHALKENTPAPELEVFVQGALCYCYSGQCLMSSFYGGRSGNRGRCAQPCRLAYELSSADGKRVETDGEYLLSPKDLCGLEQIPQLVELGVDSFKIEGRMKSPLYVAACVSAYRRALNAYYDGEFGDSLILECKNLMAEVFNRGGFTEGYFGQKNGLDMMSFRETGNAGVVVGKVSGILRGQVRIALERAVHRGDLFLLKGVGEEVSLTCNVDADKGEQITLNTKNSGHLAENTDVFRVQNVRVKEELHAFCETDKKIPLRGAVNLTVSKRASLKLCAEIRGTRYEVDCEGVLVEAAEKQAISSDVVAAKLKGLGNTRYYMEELDVAVSEKAFYPMRELKELRRTAIALLEDKIVSEKRRVLNVQPVNRRAEDVPLTALSIDSSSDNDLPETVIEVSTMEQLAAVARRFPQGVIYLDLQYFTPDSIMDVINEWSALRFFVVLPHIMRREAAADIDRILSLRMSNLLGVVVRNLDELAYLRAENYGGQVVADYSLYSFNREAAAFYGEQFGQLRITLPVELNEGQLRESDLPCHRRELIVYGHQPLMVSAQCLGNLTGGCKGDNRTFFLKDRYNRQMVTRLVCRYCYNVIYNSLPTVLFDLQSVRERTDITRRLHFTIEDAVETERVLDAYLGGRELSCPVTRGHYKRGVE